MQVCIQKLRKHAIGCLCPNREHRNSMTPTVCCWWISKQTNFQTSTPVWNNSVFHTGVSQTHPSILHLLLHYPESGIEGNSFRRETQTSLALVTDPAEPQSFPRPSKRRSSFSTSQVFMGVSSLCRGALALSEAQTGWLSSSPCYGDHYQKLMTKKWG